MEFLGIKHGLQNCDDCILFRSPSILKRKFVTQLLKEFEQLFENNPIVSHQNILSHKSLIFDLSGLQRTDFSVDQMKILIALMKRYRFECFIVIPPQYTVLNTISQLNRVNMILNKTIPLFHHNEIFVFFANSLTQAKIYAHQINDLKFQYSIEFDGKFVIIHFPQSFIQPVIAQFLVELDDIFPDLSPDEHGIIIDYSKLQESDITPEQMAKAIEIVVNYGFQTLVYVLPLNSSSLQNSVSRWLDKSVQLLNTYGVRVDFADSIGDGKLIIERYTKLPEIETS
jgi:hypothetical protein